MDIRAIAYRIVKKMKAAYSQDGCDWQKLIEEELSAALTAANECAECHKPIGPAVWCSIACMEKAIGPMKVEPPTT